MFNNYMLDIQFYIGIYIRLSQEDKDKKYETERSCYGTVK